MQYNYTPSNGWDWTAGVLVKNNNVPYNQNTSIVQYQQFGFGKYSVKIKIGTAGSGRSLGLVFGSQSNSSFYVPGNAYYNLIQTTTNNTFLYRYVAGAATLLDARCVTPFGINTTHFHAVDVRWNDTGGILVSVDGSQYSDVIDRTFGPGYVGVGKGGTATISNAQFDDLIVNETPHSGFACTPTSGFLPHSVTCTQSGDNYSDPGVNASWIWGDGTTSTGTTGTHTYYLPGLYSVSLLNSNVAGTSSAVQNNYINAGGPGYPHIEPSSPTITDEWDAFLTKIFGVFT